MLVCDSLDNDEEANEWLEVGEKCQSGFNDCDVVLADLQIKL